MTLRIEYSPLCQLPESKYKNFILYGTWGVGKTTVLSTMDGYVLVVNDEKRLSALKAAFKDSPEQLGRYTTVNIYDEPNRYLSLKKLYDDLSQQEQFPKWIVWDSLSSIAKTIVNGKLNGTSNAGKKIHGQAAYGDSNTEILELLNLFCKLPTNFVVICHLSRHTDQEGVTTLSPGLPGKQLAEDIPYLFDCIYFYERIAATKKNAAQAYFQVERDARAEAKNCMAVGTYLPPDFGAIAQLIEEGS